jgi:DnaJ family protein C protein 1
LDPGESLPTSDDREGKPPPSVSGGLWTDDDIAELVRLVKKFPPGTACRWEKVANLMGRSVAEVTHMAKKVKEDGYKIVTSGGNLMATEQEPLKLGKMKTRAAVVSSEVEWSQVQQKALEAALTKYPKGGNADRWDKIAKCVPGKGKVRCMVHEIGHLCNFVGQVNHDDFIENFNICIRACSAPCNCMDVFFMESVAKAVCIY